MQEPSKLTKSFLLKLSRSIVFFFFNHVHCEGIENVPEYGEPTFFVFNHSNGLCDSLLTFVVLKDRYVRFCAKDSLKDHPFFGFFVKACGCVGVQRKLEHATPDNREFFQNLYDELREGKSIAIAPEGQSRFVSQMMPLKTGTARVSFESIRLNMDRPGYKINIVPCGLTYMHREKWRTAALIQLGEPIVVTKEFVSKYPESSFEGTRLLTNQIAEGLEKVTMNAPGFEEQRLAMVANRLYKPSYGARITLLDYIQINKHFIKIFESAASDKAEELPNVSVKEVQTLHTSLKLYQDALDRHRIKDYRIGQGLQTKNRLRWKMFVRFMMSGVWFAFSFIGLLWWLPVLFQCKRAEHKVKKMGLKDNLDTVMETKVMWGMILLPVHLSITMSVFWFFFGIKMAFLLFIPFTLYLWMTVRGFEDGIASARAFCSLYRVYKMPVHRFNQLRQQRRKVQLLVRDIASRTNAPEIDLEKKEVIVEDENVGKNRRKLKKVKAVVMNKLSYFSIRQRRRKDWNETLRLWDVSSPMIDNQKYNYE
eukprot:TRINITY_DN773063_c0_g1_i1.p1 TRINITY_DN773063_c0_g1~~TRINITY_DN773063_c0_g1_i1.p1  ORF type:complete len:536 (-),score=170.77 TRINITY_DN773063_c0_g1_i1:599-2206(-)